MPYQYRKLTPKGREEVLQKRIEQGYPLHSPPHPYRQEGYYLLTAANFEHIPIIETSDRRTEFECLLLHALEANEAEISGWVVLPNHYHVLVGVSSFAVISRVCHQIHGESSRKWNQADGMTGKRRVWYKFSDQLIRNEAHFYRALNYIHFNPVKHGYVRDTYEWPWSSLKNYYEYQGRDWLRQKWVENPPGDFGSGWDN